jgi:hypothetical protein
MILLVCTLNDMNNNCIVDVEMNVDIMMLVQNAGMRQSNPTIVRP